MLEKVKRLLGLKDNEKDDLLTGIIGLVSDRLKLKIGAKSVPEELEYVVVEVSVARFNRIGNEGMNSYSQTEESISYGDIFADYEDEITEWKDNNGNGIARIGGFKFI
jgi:hypothetical protein